MDEDFSALLRTYRKSMGWTQEELSQKWSYSFETISAWERGKRTPSSQEIPRLAKFLEMSSEKLAEIVVGSRLQPLKRQPPITQGMRPDWKTSFEMWGELQHIYRTRTEFNRDFSYARMFENAHTILAAGISLNAIALVYSRDNLLRAITEEQCRIQLCFLDPDGKRCAEREEEENYPPRTLADLTGVNILLMKTLRKQIEQSSLEQSSLLDIRVYDLTPRFNIYIVDDILMTVQSYAYGRGEDTPTLLLKRQTRGGLFDFYASAATFILEHSTAISSQIPTRN
jgi:transcriptional regulator with XRE-family HTH domain